jgi:hypothetical protein
MSLVMQFGQVECALHCGFHWLPGDGEISVAAKWDMVTDQFKTGSFLRRDCGNSTAAAAGTFQTL